MNLLLIDRHELLADGTVTLTDVRASHLRTVLQVAPGSVVRVGLLEGGIGKASVIEVSADGVRIRCAVDEPAPDRPPVDLLLAAPRPKVLRRLWPQLAALGVGRIMVTNAARVERHYFDTHLLNPDVIRPLLIEGLQQARDTRLPTVSVHKQLKVLLEDELGPYADAVRLCADPATGPGISDVLTAGTNQRVLLAVGPEGGWTDYERRMFTAAGFALVSMGPRTLRSDTACIALLALVHAGVRLSRHASD